MKRTGKGSVEQALRLESLEERIAPAGAVTVKAAGANLTITGDAEANDITIDQPLAGQFHIVGNNGTLINGQAEVTFDDVLGNVTIKMGDGDDAVAMDSADTTGRFSFDGGRGNDTLTADGSSFGSSASFKGGDGDDFVTIDTANFNGGLAFSGGKGNDQFTLHIVTGSDPFKVSGDDGNDMVNFNVVDTNHNAVAFTGGAGDFNVGITNYFSGPLSIKAGKGANVVSMADATVDSLKYAGGAFSDTVNLANLACEGAASLAFGNAETNLDISGSTFMTSFAVKGGKGAFDFGMSDSIVRQTATLAGGRSVTGFSLVDSTFGIDVANGTVSDLKLKLSGDSVVRFTDCTFGRDFLSTGAGSDCDVELEGGDVAGSVSIKSSALWAGAQLSTTVHGSTTITFGRGNDDVWFDDAHLIGALTINAGAGNDDFEFDSSGDPLGPASLFDGPVSIKLGSGDDDLIIGLDDAGNKSEFADVVVIDGGSGDDLADYLTYGNTFAIDPVFDNFETTT